MSSVKQEWLMEELFICSMLPVLGQNQSFKNPYPFCGWMKKRDGIWWLKTTQKICKHNE